MTIPSNKKARKPEAGSSKRDSEFKTKIFSKSGYPATAKDTIKMILNLFVNLFS